MVETRKPVLIDEIPVDRYTREEFAQIMVDTWRANRSAPAAPKVSFSINGQVVSMVRTDPDFRADFLKADQVDADGASIVFASRWFTKTPIPERVATTDYFHDAARHAQDAGMSFYFLGASEEVNQSAVANVQRAYPRLKIAGHRHGYFSEADEAEIIGDILASGADVLWVALGNPKQTHFAIRHREALTGVTWIKTCGGLFDFLAERNSRAPEWMQKYGFEWAYRVYQEPRRLFWRYLTTNVHAIWLLARHTKSA